MASYYYLISSLPMLKTDGSIEMDFDTFLHLCQSNVSEKTYHALENPLELSGHHPLMKAWSDFYKRLTDELNYQRNLNLGRPSAAPDNRDSEIINNVAAALAAENPLIAEQMLLELEFRRIDSLMGIHSFDEYYLFGYAIKLKLLERQAVFTKKAGQEEFEMLFNGVRDQILQM